MEATNERTRSGTLSERVLGLTWDTMDLGDGLVAVPDRARALEFVQGHYARIFGHDKRSTHFYDEPSTPAKKRFIDEMDVYTFCRGDSVIGISMGHPADWSTYYFRTIAVLPEEQSRGVSRTFLRRALSRLSEAGVRRAEGECNPTNVPMQRFLASEGFLVTGSVASERWGLVLRLTKFLDPDAQAAFARAFSNMSTTDNPRRT